MAHRRASCSLGSASAGYRGYAAVIEADRSLTKTFGATLAVDHLNLTIKPGEVFCLLGANGAGKTTTINLFLNFIAPTSGVARIGGLDVVEHPLETKQRLAYIPEQVTLYRNLTGLENLRFFSRLAKARRRFRRRSCSRSSRRPASPPTRRATASAPTRRACGRRSASRSRSRRARRRCCSTSRPRGSIRRPSNDFSTLLADLSGARRRHPDGDARSVSRQGIRHVCRYHEARPAGRDARHRRTRPPRSRTDLSRSHEGLEGQRRRPEGTECTDDHIFSRRPASSAPTSLAAQSSKIPTPESVLGFAPGAE